MDPGAETRTPRADAQNCRSNSQTVGKTRFRVNSRGCSKGGSRQQGKPPCGRIQDMILNNPDSHSHPLPKATDAEHVQLPLHVANAIVAIVCRRGVISADDFLRSCCGFLRSHFAHAPSKPGGLQCESKMPFLGWLTPPHMGNTVPLGNRVSLAQCRVVVAPDLVLDGASLVNPHLVFVPHFSQGQGCLNGASSVYCRRIAGFPCSLPGKPLQKGCPQKKARPYMGMYQHARRVNPPPPTQKNTQSQAKPCLSPLWFSFHPTPKRGTLKNPHPYRQMLVIPQMAGLPFGFPLNRPKPRANMLASLSTNPKPNPKNHTFHKSKEPTHKPKPTSSPKPTPQTNCPSSVGQESVGQLHDGALAAARRRPSDDGGMP